MRLTAYILSGQTLGVDLTGWIDSDLNGNPPFIVLFNSGSTVPSGYTDISSIEHWDSIPVLDWARRRDGISPLFYEIAGVNLSNYSALTTTQKIIGAQYFFVPYSLRVTNGIVTEEQDIENWSFLLSETKVSRENCVEAMRKHVGQYIRTGLLTLAQTQQFYKDTRVFIQWFNEVNLYDLIQWISNTPGSPYENDGFAQQTYFNANLRDELIEIYNGDY